jgi:predicted nuclease of predicted toxin-antitoxin system
MRILLDESVSLRLAAALREDGHEVVAVAESAERGMGDDAVWSLACDGAFLLLTRDYHFTNPARFNPEDCAGIVFVRRGNLKASDEVDLIRSFFANYSPDVFKEKLVTLSPGRVWIR